MGNLATKIAGGVCVAAGFATLWLPIPTGLVLLVVGLSLLIMSSPHVALWLRVLRRRNAGLDARLNQTEPLLPGQLQRALARTKARARPDRLRRRAQGERVLAKAKGRGWLGD